MVIVWSKPLHNMVSQHVSFSQVHHALWKSYPALFRTSAASSIRLAARDDATCGGDVLDRGVTCILHKRSINPAMKVGDTQMELD